MLTRATSRAHTTRISLCRAASNHAHKPSVQAQLEPTLEQETEAPEKIYARLPKPQKFSLPDPKLRALIDLYHSASTFITPETLSDEIDKAFTSPRFNATPVRPESYADLYNQRVERAAEPGRIVPTANELDGKHTTFDTFPGGSNEGWSTSKGERERAVKGALWGVDPIGRIGLETLLEAKAEIDQFGTEETSEDPKQKQ